MLKSIVIEKLFGGYAPNNSNGSTPVEGASNQYTNSGVMNPFRQNFIGHIAPGECFTGLTDGSTRVNALPLNGIVDSAGEAFCVLDNARVVQFGVGDDTVDAHNATAHSGHASLVGEDIISYKNATDEYVLYSLRDATDWDVGRRTKSSGAYVDTFLSGLGTQTSDSGSSARTFNKGNPGKMVIGSDGIIYRTNGSWIASHDPTTTTVNYAALSLGEGWVTTSLSTFGIFIAIVGYQATSYITSFSRSQSRLWLWDGYSPRPNHVFDLNDNYVSAIYNVNEILYIFSQGRDNKSRVKVFNGQNIQTVFEQSVNAIGNSPKHGGIELYRGMLHFAQTSGNFFISALDGKAYHNVMVPNSIAASPLDLGMVKELSLNGLYAGAKTGSSTYKLLKINQSSYYTPADLRTILYPLPRKSTITKIRVDFSQFAAASSVILSLFTDYAALSIGGATDKLNTTINTTNYPTVVTDQSVVVHKRIPNVNAFNLNVRFNHNAITDTAAIVRKIEVEYEETDKP